MESEIEQFDDQLKWFKQSIIVLYHNVHRPTPYCIAEKRNIIYNCIDAIRELDKLRETIYSISNKLTKEIND